MIDKNEQITMDELLFDMKHKYNNLDITRQHLGRVIRYKIKALTNFFLTKR